MPVVVAIAAFLLFVALFALAARFGTTIAGERLGRKIDRLHRHGEFILDTERAPDDWFVGSATRPEAGGGMRAQIARRRVFARMRRLIRYFELSPVFTEIESREYVVGELQRIRESWKRMPLSDIRGDSDGTDGDDDG